MHLSFRRAAALLLLAALVFYLTTRAIVPAFSRVDSDFPNYLTAAKIVAEAGDVRRLYDDRWFQAQMRRYDMGSKIVGKFSPFPPPTALLLLPLSALAPLDALRVFTVVSLLCLIGSIFLLARIQSWRLVDTAVFVLLSGYAAIGALRLGQPYILVSGSCILGYYAYLAGRPVLAGMCFGLFTPIKYFPVVFLVYFAVRRQWRLVLAGFGTTLAISLLSIGVLGWSIHREFLESVLGNHLLANLSLQDPFTASFQSFDTLFRRLLIFDAVANPQPWLLLPSLQPFALAITKGSLLLVGIATLVKLARIDPASSTAPSIGLLGILTLLLAPATASYHFTLLWLPVALLIGYFVRERMAFWGCFVLAVYTLIGFFPYRFSQPFEGRGGLTLLAYPRLLLLSLMFVGCVYAIWRRPESHPAVVRAQC
jgi:Glycosyltransferase family 87